MPDDVSSHGALFALRFHKAFVNLMIFTIVTSVVMLTRLGFLLYQPGLSLPLMWNDPFHRRFWNSIFGSSVCPWIAEFEVLYHCVLGAGIGPHSAVSPRHAKAKRELRRVRRLVFGTLFSFFSFFSLNPLVSSFLLSGGSFSPWPVLRPLSRWPPCTLSHSLPLSHTRFLSLSLSAWFLLFPKSHESLFHEFLWCLHSRVSWISIKLFLILKSIMTRWSVTLAVQEDWASRDVSIVTKICLKMLSKRTKIDVFRWWIWRRWYRWRFGKGLFDFRLLTLCVVTAVAVVTASLHWAGRNLTHSLPQREGIPTCPSTSCFTFSCFSK